MFLRIKKIHIVVGIAGFFLVAYFVVPLIDSIINPPYPEGFPKIKENNFRCESSWSIKWRPGGDYESEQVVREALSQLGSQFDVSQRKITVSSSEIKIQGEWNFLESDNAKRLSEILTSQGFIMDIDAGFGMGCSYIGFPGNPV